MKPKLDKGAVMTLAGQIQQAMWRDIRGRNGFDINIDRKTLDELRQEQTNLIAEEIERFFA